MDRPPPFSFLPRTGVATIMATIQAPRYFTTRHRTSGAYHVWQPASRLIQEGWKAAPLLDARGKPSPPQLAMAQAEWLNALFDAARAGDDAVCRLIQINWGKGAVPDDLSLRFPKLMPCPAIPYQVPGLAMSHATARPGTFAALDDLYRKSHFFLNLSPRTQISYRSNLVLLQPLVGPTPVAQLTRKPLRKLYEALLKKDGVSVANGRMRVMSVVLSYGVEIEWLQGNPLSRFRLSPVPGRIRIPTEAEIAALVKAALTRMPEGPRHDAVGLIIAAAMSGQRRGDLVESITLEGFRAGRVAFAQQKTKAFVNFEMTAELIEAGAAMLADFEKRWGDLDKRFAEVKIATRQAWFRHLDKTPLLWNVDRGIPMDRFSATRLFARVRAEAVKICKTAATVRLQDFRDYLVTELFRAGCSDAEVGAITGHSARSVGMKRKHYFDQFDPVVAANAMAKLKTRRDGFQ